MASESRRTAVSVELGVLLALVGGFLDGYSILSLNGVFANAQTGNVVLLGVEAARGDWRQAAQHVPPIVAFVLGVVVAETLKRPRVVAVVRWPARAVLVLEIVVLTMVGFLPAAVPAGLKVMVIAFVASLQVSTFRTLITWSYNTTMMTGNLRSASQALYLALADRDPESAAKTRNFAMVIAGFLAGAVVGSRLTLLLGAHTIWLAAVVLVAALSLFIYDDLTGRVRG